MPRVRHGGHEAAAGAAAAATRYGAPRPPPGVLCKSYRCHSMACLDRPGLELGDKIIMPQSAFKEAHQLRLKLPLLFKVVGRRRRGIVGPPPCQFCGVLEFSARQDQVFLPYWMMQNLLLSEGEQVELRSILHPPTGSFVRFRPHDDTFLNVAAQQGPKALMECTLRRYSVLSEGVTILVQHENENFFLDVVELRTSASPLAGIGAEEYDEGYSSEFCDDGGRERLQDDDDNGWDGNGRDLAGGKRVRLVSLLGDLDLEVEFCLPPPRKTEEHLAEFRGAEEEKEEEQEQEEEKEQSTTKALAAAAAASGHDPVPLSHIPAGTSMQDCAVGAGSLLLQTESAAVYLPAPAKAKSCDSVVVATAVAEPSRTAGWLGIPSREVFGRLSKCRAFSGFGVALGGARSGDKNQPNPRDDRDRDHHHHHHNITRDGSRGLVEYRREETPKHCGATTDAKKSTRSAGVSDDGTQAEMKPAAHGELPGGIDAAGVAFNEPETGGRGKGGGEGRKLGEGLLDGLPEFSSPVVGSVAIGTTGPGAGGEGKTVPCDFCGKHVPLANRCVHELRCSAVRRAGIGGGSHQRSENVRRIPSAEQCGALERRREPVENVGRPLPSFGKPSTTVAGGGSSPSSADDRREHPPSTVIAASVDDSSSRDEEITKRRVRSDTNRVDNGSDGDLKGRPSIRRTGVALDDGVTSWDNNIALSPSGRRGGVAGTHATPSRDAFDPLAETGKNEGVCGTFSTLLGRGGVKAALLPPSPPPCGFCGLSFRTADAANAHETLCGTRTERCERCCGHVSRRDIEPHGKPGGACDSTIAAAVAHEEYAKAVAISAAADCAAADCAAADCAGASGMEASGGGVGVPGSGGLNGRVRSSVGKFDALLAEAIRSSKAASATLEEARVRNDGLEISLSGRPLQQPRRDNGYGTRKDALTDAPSARRVVCRTRDCDVVGAGAAGRQVAVGMCAGSRRTEGSQRGDSQAASLVRQDSTGATPTLSSHSFREGKNRAGGKRSDTIEPMRATAAVAAKSGMAPSAQRANSTCAAEHQRWQSDSDGMHSSSNHGLDDGSQQEETLTTPHDGTSIIPPLQARACAVRESLAPETTNQLVRGDGVSSGWAMKPGDRTALDEAHGSTATGGDDADGERSKGAESVSVAGREQWACSWCTLENSSRVAACDACGSTRVDNGVDGHRVSPVRDYCVPGVSAEAAAVGKAVEISAENIVGARNPSEEGCADASEVNAGTAATSLALAAGASEISHALLKDRQRGKPVSPLGIEAFPSDRAPAGSIHSLMDGKDSSLPSDPVLFPSTASLTTPLDSCYGPQPRRVNSSSNNSSDDAKEHGGRGGLSGAGIRLGSPPAVSGSLTGSPVAPRGRSYPWSPAVRTPELRPITANIKTAAGFALKGNAADAPGFTGVASPTVLAGAPHRIGLDVHPIPTNVHGSTPPPHATRFKHPRKPEANKARVRVGWSPRGDPSTHRQQVNNAQQGRGSSTEVRMRPRRLGGVERPPGSRYPRLSPPSDEPTAHSASVTYPRTVPELAATTDLFSRPLSLRSSSTGPAESTGLAASYPEGRGHRKPWRQNQQQQQEHSVGAASRSRLRGEHGSSGSRSGSSSNSGSGSGSGGGGPVVRDTDGHADAPACDLSLSILGRNQGAYRLSMDPVSGIRASVGVGQVQAVEGAKRRVPQEPVRGVIGGSRARYERGGRDRRIGVAPSKLRRRVSDTRVLEPLHPD